MDGTLTWELCQTQRCWNLTFQGSFPVIPLHATVAVSGYTTK